VLFGSSVRDRAEETGSSERTLYRKAARFDREGIDSLFDSAGAKRRELPPVVRRMIVELKAEYPGFSLGEIAYRRMNVRCVTPLGDETASMS
jgi:transposase